MNDEKSTNSNSNVTEESIDSKNQHHEINTDYPETKRKNKKPIIIGCLIVVLLIITVSVVKIVLPLVRYNSAGKAFKERDYITAETLYTELGNYNDSPERAKEAILAGYYYEGVSFYESGDYANAITSFTNAENILIPQI